MLSLCREECGAVEGKDVMQIGENLMLHRFAHALMEYEKWRQGSLVSL